MSTVTRRSSFAAIPNAMMRDERLSIEARGLLALMMGMGSKWTFRSKDLIRRCGVGREKYQRMVRELRDAGYLEMVRIQGSENGKFDGWDYIIHDEPESLKTRPSVKPTDGKPDHLRIPTSKNTNKEEPLTPKGELSLFSENEQQESQPDRSEIPNSEKEKPTKEKLDCDFAQFWLAYPKKAGKPAARKAWDKAIKKDPPGKIIAAADRYAKWLKEPLKPGEFRPHPKHPQGWLNDERWNDPELQEAAERPLTPMQRRARALTAGY